MKIFIILLNKFIYFIGKLINKGSSMPGKISLKLDKNILKKVKLPKNIVMVTGSNGKTSTTEIINSILSDDLEPFTPTEMMSVEKFSGYILDPTGKYLIMAVKKWNPDTGKSYSHLRYKNIETSETKILTPQIEGQSDSSPQFSSAFPNYLFF